MSTDKLAQAFENVENKYLIVLTAAKRSRQLLGRAEKHGMSADTEKVIIQSLEEVVSGKVTFEMDPLPTMKKKSKD